jgi:hypothetical protein
MGRLTLNVLLSFAQFEREVTAERIRDKIAASKAKGMWMGGNVPLGYDVQNRKLLVNAPEAERVREIFRRYLQVGNVRELKRSLEKDGIRSKVRILPDGSSAGDKPFSRGSLYAMLVNPIYMGEIRHGDLRHAGQHEAILDRELWNRVQAHLAANHTGRAERARVVAPSPLIGKLFDNNGGALTPSHTVKKGRRYRYYISRALVTGTIGDAASKWRLPAPDLDLAVARSAITMLRDRSLISAAMGEAEIGIEAFPLYLAASAKLAERLDKATEAEQPSLLRNLVERVQVAENGLSVTLSLDLPD